MIHSGSAVAVENELLRALHQLRPTSAVWSTPHGEEHTKGNGLPGWTRLEHSSATYHPNYSNHYNG